MCVGEEIPHELELVPESIKSHLNGNKRANNLVHFVTIVILSLLLVRIW